MKRFLVATLLMSGTVAFAKQVLPISPAERVAREATSGLGKKNQKFLDVLANSGGSEAVTAALYVAKVSNARNGVGPEVSSTFLKSCERVFRTHTTTVVNAFGNELDAYVGIADLADGLAKLSEK